MNINAHNYVRDPLRVCIHRCSECLVVRRREQTGARTTWTTKEGNILLREPQCCEYTQDDEDAAPRGCAEEPEFMWLGRPQQDRLRVGPLELEEWMSGSWRVVLSVPDDRVTQRIVVAHGTNVDIDVKTRAWIQSLTELVPKW